MTYWTDEGHVKAEGDVYAVLRNGSTMRGPVADYYRVVPGVRTQTMLVATGRPRLGIVQIDSATKLPTDTVRVVAEHITTVADSVTFAGGDVHITRPDLLATGDSAYMDNGTGLAQLMGRPTVEARTPAEGRRTEPFTLTGGRIDVFSNPKKRVAERIIASPSGHVTSRDVQLFADSVVLGVSGNKLDRAMAFGKSRARALAADQDVLADSIDAILPNQQLQELRAVRNAYATNVPDTTTILTDELDWVRGDTLIAVFDTLPSRDLTTSSVVPIPGARASSPTDSTRRQPIRSIFSRLNAHAYYHIATTPRFSEKPTPAERTRAIEAAKRKPALNYVVGRDIDIAFQQGKPQRILVTGRAGGVYLEPLPDSAIVQRPAAQSNKPAPPPKIPTR